MPPRPVTSPALTVRGRKRLSLPPAARWRFPGPPSCSAVPPRAPPCSAAAPASSPQPCPAAPRSAALLLPVPTSVLLSPHRPARPWPGPSLALPLRRGWRGGGRGDGQAPGTRPWGTRWGWHLTPSVALSLPGYLLFRDFAFNQAEEAKPLMEFYEEVRGGTRLDVPPRGREEGRGWDLVPAAPTDAAPRASRVPLGTGRRCSGHPAAVTTIGCPPAAGPRGAGAAVPGAPGPRGRPALREVRAWGRRVPVPPELCPRQIKKYEKLDSEEERAARSRHIFDHYIMKELLSCSHVSAGRGVRYQGGGPGVPSVPGTQLLQRELQTHHRSLWEPQRGVPGGFPYLRSPAWPPRPRPFGPG